MKQKLAPTPPKLVVTLPPTIAHYNGTCNGTTPKVGRHPPLPGTLKWHLQWHHVYCTQQSHHVHSLKVGRHPSSTLQWHPAMAPPPPPTTAHYNGTLQWHPAMAPRPLPPKWSSPSPPPTIAHYNGTLQWHPAMAPRPLPPKLVVALPSPHHSTLQWHPAMAPSNGTTSAPPKLVVTLPLNHSTLQWHPTMAPSNGTTSTAPCNGTLVPRPIRQSGSSPSPLLEVRTPIAIAIWGTINMVW